MNEGQFVAAHRAVAGMIDAANHNASPLEHQADLWRLLGLAENCLGHYEKAKAALNQALELCYQNRTSTPEFTISILVELADANLKQGLLDHAHRMLRRAMEVASKDLPPGHPRLASVHHSLGVLFWMQGNLSRAEKAFRTAVSILENSLGPDHADVAVTASGLAGLLMMTRRHTEAIPLFEQSKTVFERDYGRRHPDTIGATFALGTALMQSDPRKAELMLREAIAKWRASQPERHPHMVKFLRALATARFAQGDYREAANLSRQALQMSKEIFGPEHPHAIAQIYEHAQLLKDSRRGKEAAALKKDADRIRALKGYSDPGHHRIDILALR